VARPAGAVARGYAFVHSLKNDERMDEAEARAYFAGFRGRDWSRVSSEE
jgi:hypothetical protein